MVFLHLLHEASRGIELWLVDRDWARSSEGIKKGKLLWVPPVGILGLSGHAASLPFP